MMRAPMSRMDVLTKSELSSLIDNSKLVEKYKETIDRESAYEILEEKIQASEEEKAEEKKRKEKTKTTRSSSSRKSTRQNPVVKVLTSATFIRAAFGILKKLIR